MSRWLEPIEAEDGRCRTEVILDEAEVQPQRSRPMRQQLRLLYKLIDEDFMSPYRERILRALGSHKLRYVLGADIDGTDLYEFPWEPRLTGPLHCMLCGDGFASDAALEKHVVESHVSMAEYRKRVLFKYEERGPEAVTPSEKKTTWCRTSPISSNTRTQELAAASSPANLRCRDQRLPAQYAHHSTGRSTGSSFTCSRLYPL